MTNEFQAFIDRLRVLIKNFQPDAAREYIDEFWGDYQDVLEYDPASKKSEYDIVGDIFELADRYNESPAIVASDSYCIGPETFKRGLIEKLDKYGLLDMQ